MDVLLGVGALGGREVALLVDEPQAGVHEARAGAERRVGDSHPGASGLLDARAREQRAAEDRLECYRSFGAELPADGGTPTVLAPVPSRPARPSRSAQPSRSRAAAAARRS